MASYPAGPFSIEGECNCSAIQYTARFPSEAERPLVLSADRSNGQGDIRLPQTAICFCNDCRRASGGLVLFALMVPFDLAKLSLSRKNVPERMEFIANEYFPPKKPSAIGQTSMLADTYLSMYQSSEKALRAFCSKCGTPIVYIYTKPIPPGATSGGLDFYLGTVKKGNLEDIGNVDRFVRSDLGIDWVKDLFARHEKVPWHPGTDMSDF